MNESQLLTQIYSKLGRCAPGSTFLARRVGTLCGLDGDANILCAGCGAGATPLQLASEYGCKVTCMERDQEARQPLLEFARSSGVEHLAEQCFVEELDDASFERGRYTTLLLEGALTAMGAPLSQVVEALAPALVAEGLVAMSSFARVGRLSSHQSGALERHFKTRLLTPGEVAESLDAVGFNVFAIEAFDLHALSEHFDPLGELLDGAQGHGPRVLELQQQVELYRSKRAREAVNLILLVAQRR